MNETFKAIIDAAGGTPVHENGSSTSRWGHRYESGIAHEVGTVRMGPDPKTSAFNGFCELNL
jgi:hypothetical protein